jgi:hypothetical protein
MKSTDTIEWERVSAGHYDSADGKWRIDTCKDNKARFELYMFTEGMGGSEPSYEGVGCYPNQRDAKAAAQDMVNKWATPTCDKCTEPVNTTIDNGRGTVRLCALHANVAQFGGVR